MYRKQSTFHLMHSIIFIILGVERSEYKIEVRISDFLLYSYILSSINSRHIVLSIRGTYVHTLTLIFNLLLQATPRSNTYPRPAKVNSPKMHHRTMSPESPLTKRHSSSTCATSPSTKRRTQGHGSPNSLRRFTASPDSPTMRRHMGSSTGSSLSMSSRSRTNSIDSPGTHRKNIKYLSPQEQDKNLPRSEGLLGSGEYYDRLSPRLDQLAEQYSSIASSYSNHHTGYEQSRDYSSLDRKGMTRLANNRIHVYHTELNM